MFNIYLFYYNLELFSFLLSSVELLACFIIYLVLNTTKNNNTHENLTYFTNTKVNLYIILFLFFLENTNLDFLYHFNFEFSVSNLLKYIFNPNTNNLFIDFFFFYYVTNLNLTFDLVNLILLVCLLICTFVNQNINADTYKSLSFYKLFKPIKILFNFNFSKYQNPTKQQNKKIYSTFFKKNTI